jgi:hypothetical protein
MAAVKASGVNGVYPAQMGVMLGISAKQAGARLADLGRAGKLERCARIKIQDEDTARWVEVGMREMHEAQRLAWQKAGRQPLTPNDCFKPKAKPPQHDAVLRMLVKAGMDGISATDIAKTLPGRYSLGTVIDWLNDLQKQGKAERNNNGGPGCRWGVPGVHAAWKQRRKDADAARKRVLRQIEAESKAGPLLSDEPEQHVVPAGAKPPPKTTAARSIFEVATA